jgi:hypothetical protein
MRALVVCAIVLLGCGDPRGEPGGAIAGGGADASTELAPQSPSGQAAFACDQGTTAAPEALRRLTMTQYRNTVRDLVRWALGDPLAADVMVTMAGLDALPVDRREPTAQDPRGGYRRLDQAVDQAHVEQTYRVASVLGGMLAAPAHLVGIAGPCATDADASNDEACVTQFIRRFGARALRRPPAAEDETFYRAVHGSDPAAGTTAYAEVITVMLSSPEFLYFVEHGETEVAAKPGTYRLSAHELASRLSYHFWQTLPDDELWQTAQDGSLLRPDVLARQVDRLMADARARATMAELFSDLLGLDDLPALDAHARDPVFAAFAGDDLPGPELRQQVTDEALDLLAHYTWTDPGGMRELLTSDLSFARGEALARIYGVPPWDGSSAPPVLPVGERAGLLTRAWLLATGSASSRPIQRGVFVRRRLLCDELAPPPANVSALLPAVLADRTTRRAIEELTEQPGTACASCHASLINPLGFAFEGFDALGRVRTEQVSFDDDGTRLGAWPVDTVTVPRVTPTDESISTGPADLMELMLDSGKLEACLARHYFRFTFGRHEDLARDGCALQRLHARLAESGRIRDMVQEAALLPELHERRFEP